MALNGKVSKLNEVIKEMKFVQKKSAFQKGERDLVIRMELITGKVVEMRVKDKTISDLISTLRECGMEQPYKSFAVEDLVGTMGTGYQAVVVRLNDKRGSSEQYMIPYNIQSMLETIHEFQTSKKTK